MSMSRQPRTDKLAETLFARACDVAGASSNKSLDDQYGWDFLLQLPSPGQEGPPDLSAAGLTALVQIKSTVGAKHSVTLKVSNALRMAQEATPCFIVAMAFDKGAAEPHTVWVLHIWKDEIFRALEAARRAHLKGSPLNQARLSLPMTDAQRCDPLKIVERIESELSAFGSGYAAAKAAIYETVGYEGGRGGGTITFRVESNDEVIDHLLGRIPDLEAIWVDMREERFGLPGPVLIPNEPGRFSFEAKPHEPCQLMVSRDGEEMVFDGSVYVPGVPDIPPELFKVRFQSEFLEVVWRQVGPTEVNASFGGSKQYAITSCLQLITLISWLQVGEVELAIWVQHREFTRGPLVLSEGNFDDAEWERVRDALAGILSILPKERWPKDATFRLKDLWTGGEALARFATRVSTDGFELGIPEAPPQLLELLVNVEHHIAPVLLQLGGVTIFAFIAAPVVGHAAVDGDAKIRMGPPRILHRGVLSGGAGENWEYLKQAYGAFREKHAGPTTLQVLLPDSHEAGDDLVGIIANSASS
jgi:hypothetical protein